MLFVHLVDRPRVGPHAQSTHGVAQINLQRSLTGSEYQPIRGRGQPFWVCGRDNWAFSCVPSIIDRA
jgi:hypothetical protein